MRGDRVLPDFFNRIDTFRAVTYSVAALSYMIEMIWLSLWVDVRI